ncbi:hypothetical protein B0G76_8240 [Paraburkholderia sp. BL23I1N1]|uniref:hypothetical protein n=1 Tax=Paraburkholderia sp. BL23I1N1 TaxID=1938802 RepID=UPI000E737638|nr:hypothetical protein [Paraburkholderia sp. BL23I1N1]RKE24357.1 hypothetical protein B0G76_8240 [Paraburkholderia sp. BL23I1N1]
MSSLATSVITIVGGVIVYVIGQLVSKILIEPVHELKQAVGEVRFNLAFHAATILTPAARNEERSQKAYEALMRSSCDLLARAEAIRCFPVASMFFSLPSQESIRIAAKQIRGLSTYVHGSQSTETDSSDAVGKLVASIERHLKLAPLE